MNVFGKNARSWRKARKRAVSPIIATILLVAITVVLAAVLYVLISGLTHGTGSAPLGTNFGWGTPINDTGVTTLGCAATTFYCYGIEINVGGGLTVSNFILSLKNPTGSTIAWPASLTAAGGVVSLISPTSTTAVATYSIASSSWTVVAPFSGTITSGSSIVFYCAGHAEGAGQGLYGDEAVAVGSSGYSGTVPSATIT